MIIPISPLDTPFNNQFEYFHSFFFFYITNLCLLKLKEKFSNIRHCSTPNGSIRRQKVLKLPPSKNKYSRTFPSYFK